MPDLVNEISACELCRDRFARTETAHEPRPVVWFRREAKILIAGQAPGARVYASGRPFTDPSGDRLRAWLGMDEAEFYDRSRVAIVPMAFCFPGYDAKGSDLPPPTICARTWRTPVLGELSEVRLTVLVGAAAQRWHLQTSRSMTDVVRGWREHAPHVFPLPHPSWRNTRWLKANPWFELEVIPALRAQVAEVMQDG
ncbi:uracil-DNA glycosylase family protein [Flavimaricola marinus]|uniref:Uracil DNA glycosylase superfamily protein n=1 Tax=Flavimaricola marinus TaxID=1819565 RepID=A0A238LIW5_9RHOB|nr:uracil-DNA glycosylase family protein [Flavimaricola marinus]SMY08820.1 Uracil DNA glycosylase superfamily protein [Flavimaricola marinus]